MEENDLIPHLFRNEFSKIAAVLCKHLGISNIEIAEDIASETFLTALDSWPYKGIPENPVAWLYTVAKNKAKNYLNRNQLFTGKILPEVRDASKQFEFAEIDLSDSNITDSKLQMLFAICHPSISQEAQIGLALRILCGFGIDEIANALLINREAINKKLFRAREKLRNEKLKIEFPSEGEISSRLETVLRTLYLLFSEGYHSESQDLVLRKDLCLEAMSLTYLLRENEITNTPSVNALLALMCFHSSRFDARKNESGEIILYYDQDETLWNKELISKGAYFLNKASKGTLVSKYHLEAGIAYWYTIRDDSTEKWESILILFDELLAIETSPIAELNRIYIRSKILGRDAAIKEAMQLNLISNHYYYALLGELFTGIDNQKARTNFEHALSIAKTEAQKRIILMKIEKLRNDSL